WPCAKYPFLNAPVRWTPDASAAAVTDAWPRALVHCKERGGRRRATVQSRHDRPPSAFPPGSAPTADSHDGRRATPHGSGRARPDFPTMQGRIGPMSHATPDIRNVALAGHPGAGKTTLFEALLHAGGALQAAGTIERGNTVSDHDPIERQRGHSIDAAIAGIDHQAANGQRIHVNLIDTPGYPEFRGPALSALDAVETVLVAVDAVNGVEHGTRRLMARA